MKPVQSLFIFVSLLAQAGVYAAAECPDYFHYQDYNPTARLADSHYQQPNMRSKYEYEQILFLGNATFNDLLKPGDRVLDIGGGKGFALAQVSDQLHVHATVINTQDFSTLYPPSDLFKFKVGWAEEQLTQIETGSQDLVVDLWGGFSYSIQKKEIIEEIYRILKPGKAGYVFFHPWKTPTNVLVSGQTLGFNDYLAAQYGNVFSYAQATELGYTYGVVIKVSKPLQGPQTLSLHLTYNKPPELVQGPRNTVPAVEYRRIERSELH